MFERAKTFHALERAASVTASNGTPLDNLRVKLNSFESRYVLYKRPSD
jgi:hypothetical protein